MSADMWRRFVHLLASEVSKTLISCQKSETTNSTTKRDIAQELNPNSQLIRLIREFFILKCAVNAFNKAPWKSSSVFEITKRVIMIITCIWIQPNDNKCSNQLRMVIQYEMSFYKNYRDMMEGAFNFRELSLRSYTWIYCRKQSLLHYRFCLHL
jgi:hypothetical protein